MSDDGLYRIESPLAGAIYVRPGARFWRYNQVAVDPVTLAYKSRPSAPDSFQRRPGNYLLRLDATDRLRQGVRRAFEREMATSQGFALASEAGPGMLRISARIVDLVWEVPPPRGGESYYVDRTGEMTLIVDVRDSATGVVLARLAERQAIRPAGTGLAGGYESTPVNNWAGVADVSARWARTLREALDSLRMLRAVPMPPAPLRLDPPAN